MRHVICDLKPFNPFATDNTLVRGWKIEHAKPFSMHVVLRKKFFENSEVNASELLENFAEMFPSYYWNSWLYEMCLQISRSPAIL